MVVVGFFHVNKHRVIFFTCVLYKDKQKPNLLLILIIEVCHFYEIFLKVIFKLIIIMLFCINIYIDIHQHLRIINRIPVKIHVHAHALYMIVEVNGELIIF